jgi:molybdopterin-guanine dinucleotide biosynthesis protein A
VVGAVLTGGASRRMGRDKALVEVHGRALVAVAADALRAAGAEVVLTIGGDADALVAAAPGTRPVADLHPAEGPLGGLLTAFAAARHHAVGHPGEAPLDSGGTRAPQPEAAARTEATEPPEPTEPTEPTEPPGPLEPLERPEAAARTEPTEGNDLIVLVVACDMPAVDGPTLRALVDALVAHPSAALAAAEADGRPQPLTAAWRAAIAEPVLSAAFAAGERAPRRLLPRLEVVAVPGLDEWALADVDRPEDLRRYADAAPGPVTGRAPGAPPRLTTRRPRP